MPNPKLVKLFKLGIDIGQLSTGLNQTMELLKKFSGFVTGLVRGLVSSTQRIIGAFQRIGASILGLTKQAARLDSMRDSFNKMAASFGALGTELLAAMDEATLGMAKDADLIQSAMTGMMLISKDAMGDVTETLPMLAKIATAAARALGEDVGFMFDSITRGIGRASPMILDNIGMIIRLTSVYGDYADELGVTVKELTTVQRQEALLQEVLRQGEAYVEELGISTGGLATKQKQLAKEMATLHDTMGQAFMPIVQALQGLYSDVALAITSKLIPAFRTLGRVFSEVFGTKNPFMRWVEGGLVDITKKRIADAVDYLAELNEKGADFLGGITAAWEDYEEAVLELENEKFGPRLAQIQKDLSDRIADIWEDFEKAKVRKREDRLSTEIRKTEDHKERLLEIENRYTDQISDAVRKRDARSLLDLIRKQAEETKETKSKFAKDSDRRRADQAKEDLRAKEDAEEREKDARKSAAKQWAAVIAEAEKAYGKLAKERDKAIAASEKEWAAEVETIEETLKKQEELLEKQIKQLAEFQAEAAKPLSPFWEKFKDILTVIWEKLQLVRDVLLTLFGEDIRESVADEFDLIGTGVSSGVSDAVLKAEELREKFLAFMKIVQALISGDALALDDLGVDLKWIVEIRNFLTEVKTKIPEIKQAISDTFTKVLEGAQNVGQAMSDMYSEDVKKLLTELLPLLKALLPVLEMLAPAIAVLAVGIAITLGGALKGLIWGMTAVAEFATGWLKRFKNVLEGIKLIVTGMLLTISGLLTGNLSKIQAGFFAFNLGIRKTTIWIIRLIGHHIAGFFVTTFKILSGFFLGILEAVLRLKNVLIGNSIIPDMFQGITSAIQEFITSILKIWEDGWNGFVDIVSGVWEKIKEIITTITSGISEIILDWTGAIGESLSGLLSGPIGDIIDKITGFVGGGGGDVNMNANGWNIYGGDGRGNVENQVYDAVTQVVTGASRYTRQYAIGGR